jgi:hypothetical protein
VADVLYVLELKMNLLLVSVIEDSGCASLSRMVGFLFS